MADPANNVNFRARRHSLGCVEERKSQPVDGAVSRRLSDTNLAVRAAPAEQMQTTQSARTEGAITPLAPSPSELGQDLLSIIERIDLHLDSMQALEQRLLLNLRSSSVPAEQKKHSQSPTSREQAASPAPYNLRDLFNYSPLSPSPSPVAEATTSCDDFRPIEPVLPSGSLVTLRRPIARSPLSSQTDSTPTPIDARPAVTLPRFSPFSPFSSRTPSPLLSREGAEEGASAARSSPSPLGPSDFISADDDGDDLFFVAIPATAIDEDSAFPFTNPLIAVPATAIDDEDTGDVNDIGTSSRLPLDGASAHSERAEGVISPYAAPIIMQRSDSLDSLSSVDLLCVAGTLVGDSGGSADAYDFDVASSSAAGEQSSPASSSWISAAVTYRAPVEETTPQPLQHTARRASSPDADVGDLTASTRSYMAPASSSYQVQPTIQPTTQVSLWGGDSDDEQEAIGGAATRVSLPSSTDIMTSRPTLQFRQPITSTSTVSSPATSQPLQTAGAPRLTLPMGIPPSTISLDLPSAPMSQAQAPISARERVDAELALALYQELLFSQFSSADHRPAEDYIDSDDEGGG